MKKAGAQMGFTLLEILIVLGILATLTLMSSQTLREAIRSKIKVQVLTEESSKVRDTLKIIERDINLAFHYTDLEVEMKRVILSQRKKILKAKTSTPQAPPTPAGSIPPPQPPSGGGPPTSSNLQIDQRGCFLGNDPLCAPTPNRLNPVTYFIGKEKELYFATQNAARMSESELSADFINVGYKTQPCVNQSTEQNAGTCLVRLTSNLVEGDVTKLTNPLVLVEDITEFKLRYLGHGQTDWLESWDSQKGDKANKFPDAVEVTLTIDRAVEKKFPDKKRKISLTLVVPLRFANNQPKKEEADPADPNGNPQQASPPVPGVSP